MNLCCNVEECRDPENGGHDCRVDGYSDSLLMNHYGGLCRRDGSDDDGWRSGRREPIHDDGRHDDNVHDDNVRDGPKRVSRGDGTYYPIESDHCHWKL